MRVLRAERAADDGFRSPLAPGLRSLADAQRLADELAFASGRLAELASDPPGLYGRIATEPDPEEAIWLAFLCAYLSPLDGPAPFASIAAAHVPWSSAQPPALDDLELGPRTAHDPARGTATLDAYRAWAARAGGQAAAFAGEPSWTPQRRFARLYERLALPGLHRGARFELLVILGRCGRAELAADSLALAAAATADAVPVAAKRLLGIGDPLLLDRRAAELADACGVPLEALDLALFNWGRDEPRARLGASAADGDRDAVAVAAALGL